MNLPVMRMRVWIDTCTVLMNTLINYHKSCERILILPVRLERATRSEADALIEGGVLESQTGAGRESQADSATGLHT